MVAVAAVTVTVTVVVVVAFAAFPVEAPLGVPELARAPVVTGSRHGGSGCGAGSCGHA